MSGITLCMMDMTMNRYKELNQGFGKQIYKQINPADNRTEVFKEYRGHKGGNNQFYIQTEFQKPMLYDLR